MVPFIYFTRFPFSHDSLLLLLLRKSFWNYIAWSEDHREKSSASFFLSIWPLADCLFGPFLWRFAFLKVAMSIVLAGNWKSYPTSDGFSGSWFVSCSYRLAGNSSFTFWSLCLLICSVVLAWRRLSVALRWGKKRDNLRVIWFYFADQIDYCSCCFLHRAWFHVWIFGLILEKFIMKFMGLDFIVYKLCLEQNNNIALPVCMDAIIKHSCLFWTNLSRFFCSLQCYCCEWTSWKR